MAWCRWIGHFGMKHRYDIKSPYITLSEKNAFSRAIVPIYTSSYHSSICRKQVNISFVWPLFKHQILTHWPVTLIVSCVCVQLTYQMKIYSGVIIIVSPSSLMKTTSFPYLMFGFGCADVDGLCSIHHDFRWSCWPIIVKLYSQQYGTSGPSFTKIKYSTERKPSRKYSGGILC